MAFTLPTKTLVGDYPHIVETDPALDVDDSGFRAGYDLYVETGDEKHLKFRGGQTPTRFKLRHLRGDALEALNRLHRPMQHMSETERGTAFHGLLWEACKLSLQGWDGLAAQSGGDAVCEHTVRDGVRVVSDTTMAMLQDLGGVWALLGVAVWRATFLTPK